jgi:hypothetical protein
MMNCLAAVPNLPKIGDPGTDILVPPGQMHCYSGKELKSVTGFYEYGTCGMMRRWGGFWG